MELPDILKYSYKRLFKKYHPDLRISKKTGMYLTKIIFYIYNKASYHNNMIEHVIDSFPNPEYLIMKVSTAKLCYETSTEKKYENSKLLISEKCHAYFSRTLISVDILTIITYNALIEGIISIFIRMIQENNIDDLTNIIEKNVLEKVIAHEFFKKNRYFEDFNEDKIKIHNDSTPLSLMEKKWLLEDKCNLHKIEYIFLNDPKRSH